MSLPYSVETQTKIAKLLNADGDEQSQVATEEHFEGALMFLSITSSKIVGKPTTLSHSFASAVLGKICLTRQVGPVEEGEWAQQSRIKYVAQD